MSEEYIERGALLEELKEKHDCLMQDQEANPAVQWYGAMFYGKAEAIIENAPAADVVEVVRCENCENWREQVPEWCVPEWCGNWFGYCSICMMETTKNHFCSYADRRDGGADNG